MDSNRFDRLTKSLGMRRSRRQAIAAGVAGMTAIPLTQVSPGRAAQDAVPEATPGAGQTPPSFLFVQLAEAGNWMPNPDNDGSYLLTLSGASSQTLYFSDRPERIVGTVATDYFLEALGFSPYEPPNAAVVVQTPDGTRDVLVVELSNPVYAQRYGEDGSDLLTYRATVLDIYEGDGLQEWVPQADDDQLPQEFSSVSVFIDGCAAADACYLNGFGGIGGPLAYVGPIPGGPYPRCWFTDRGLFGSAEVCRLCEARTNDDVAWRENWLAQLCNERYESCRGNCTINTCSFGGKFC